MWGEVIFGFWKFHWRNSVAYTEMGLSIDLLELPEFSKCPGESFNIFFFNGEK